MSRTLPIVDDGEDINLTERREADYWARVRMVARALPPDIDLDDEADVVRALLAARFCSADFSDVLDEAVEIAREWRMQ